MTTAIEEAAGLFTGAVRQSVPEGGIFVFRARGASMLPLIRDGDVLTVMRAGARDALPGDVVVCSIDGGLRAHRLVRKTDGPEDIIVLYTQGDAHIWEDEPAPGESLLGKVVLVENDNGKKLRLDTAAARKAGRRIAAASVMKRMILRAASSLGPGMKNIALGRAGRLISRMMILLPSMILKSSKGV